MPPQAGPAAPAVSTYPCVPSASLDNVADAEAYKMSPVLYEVNPVPPYATPIVVAFHVPAVTVPSPVIPVYEPVIYAEPTVPEVIWLPSIAIDVDAAKVNWPWALTVKVPTDEADP